MSQPLMRTDFPGLKLLARGKVRDIYDLGDTLLLVASDRISAFDVIMNEPIPDKGFVLTKISAFWFRRMEDIVKNHLISTEVSEFPEICQPFAEELRGRSMLVKKARPLPVECIVRGYISGSAWKDYRKNGSICGIQLPPGMKESDRLPAPIFTPSTKAEIGDHDENISYEKMVQLCGPVLAEQARDYTLKIYTRARDLADQKGVIIADTKFEFGVFNDQLIIIDECLTPDSSRFWLKETYQPGGPQPSFDKQFLRDYLDGLDWNKTAPAPPLPADIIRKTAEMYREALTRITGGAM